MAVANATYLPIIGRSLTTAEQASLQSSLLLLSARFNGATCEFWGKVCGYKNDYLVAQVLPCGPLGPRVSFFSVDGGNNWTLMDDLTEEQCALCEELRGTYQGVPQYEYRLRKDIPAAPELTVELPEPGDTLKAAAAALAQAKAADGADDDAGEMEEADEEQDEQEEQEEEDEEEESPAPAPKKDRKPKFMILSVTEAKRLAHFVRIHDATCRLAVRGEYILSPEAVSAAPQPLASAALRGAVANRAFGGQPLHNALKPSCYLRTHAKASASRNEVLYGATYNPYTDFLRPITDDAPRGVWSVKYDPTLNVVGVTSWLFEGSLFWYRPGSVERGQIYYGNGERNFELFLML